MNRFHSQKLIEATDGLLKGRLNSKRRQTILRQNNIYEILKSLSPFLKLKKLPPYSFIYWKSAPSVKNISVRNILIACRHLPKLNKPKLSKLNHRYV